MLWVKRSAISDTSAVFILSVDEHCIRSVEIYRFVGLLLLLLLLLLL